MVFEAIGGFQGVARGQSSTVPPRVVILQLNHTANVCSTAHSQTCLACYIGGEACRGWGTQFLI